MHYEQSRSLSPGTAAAGRFTEDYALVELVHGDVF